MTSARPRILYIVREYPQISQTYIKAEIDAIKDRYDIRVLALAPADTAEPRHLPFVVTSQRPKILEVIREFKPQLIHTHYLVLGKLVGELAAEAGLPFTMRSHSFDVLETEGNRAHADWDVARTMLRADGCLGVLCFPFLRAELERFGIPPDKLIDVPPVVAVSRFLDRSPNGRAIMNMGAVRPKKQMQDFVELSRLMPGREFNLYALGYRAPELKAYAEQRGGPVNFIPPVPHDDMPAEYKKHEWLVYTAHPGMKSVGWPMAVAEAQASGVGVCIAGIRPDLQDYVGGAGYLYRDIREVKEIISAPPSAAQREAGFEQARKSDINTHIHKLTDLWDGVV